MLCVLDNSSPPPVSIVFIFFAFLTLSSLFNIKKNSTNTMTKTHPDWDHVATFTHKGSQYGCRSVHKQTGFVLDALHILFVPQALIYADTPLQSDAGESHILEHVLLGKGNKATYLRTLEEVSLVTATAFTERKRTVYTFQTKSSKELFYELFEAKLDALLHPDFSDLQVEHEVMHMTFDPEGKAEEKGTVYVEQCGAFKTPTQRSFHHLNKLVFGADHPLSYEQGGTPEAIRSIKASDVRSYHQAHYNLNTMGAIIGMGEDLDTLLGKVSASLTALSQGKVHAVSRAVHCGRPPVVESTMPTPAPERRHVSCSFPHTNASHPGVLIFCWPLACPDTLSTEEDGWLEYSILLAFVELMFNGQNSLLYTQVVSKVEGLTSLSGGSLEDKGISIYATFEGITQKNVDDPAFVKGLQDSVRRAICDIHEWGDASSDLDMWNVRCESYLNSNLKRSLEYLQHPPGFGERGKYGDWLTYLDKAVEFAQHLTPPGVIELTYDREAAAIKDLIGSKKNFWRGYIEKWGLLADAEEMIVVACTASDALLSEEKRGLQERCAHFADSVAQSGMSSAEYVAAETAKVAADEARQKAHNAPKALPTFTASPPLSNDPEMNYEHSDGIVSCVVDALGDCGYVGVAFDITTLPEEVAFHIPILTSINAFGVWRDGERVTYAEYCRRAQHEVLHLDAHLSCTASAGRVELVVRGGGLVVDEVQHALGWMEAVLTRPDWEVNNLDRIRDVVEDSIRSIRKTLQSRAEFWGTAVSSAFLNQHNYHNLQAACCLTQEFSLLREKCLISDVRGEVIEKIAAIANEGVVANVKTLISDLEAMETSTRGAFSADLLHILHCMPGVESGREDVPSEWKPCIQLLASDMQKTPTATLDAWKEVLRLVRSCPSRGHVVTSTMRSAETKAKLRALMTRLCPNTTSPPPVYTHNPVKSRWTLREGSPFPAHCTLVVASQTQGVVVHSMPLPVMRGGDLSEADMRRIISAKSLCGGGAHTLFVGAWNKGLAYSSGMGCADADRVLYYADHCPNVANTLDYAEKFLGDIESTPPAGLLDYALCQCFTSRSGQTYNQRCEALSYDIADGMLPQQVEAFRTRLLSMRDTLTDADVQKGAKDMLQLFDSDAASDSKHLRFVIGNAEQFDMYAAHIGKPVAKIYISDFWLGF